MLPLTLALHCAVLCYAVQDGSQLHLSESDRKALVFGLAMHEKGRTSLKSSDIQVRPC